jgi:hypothetical protein
MKRIKIALFVLPIVLLAACSGDADKLRDHGAETTATLLTKSEAGSSRKHTGSHSFDLMFMAKDTAQIRKDAHVDDVWKDTTISFNERLDKWDPSGGGIGTMTSVTITVNSTTFQKYQPGQRVPIVYLPEDPQVVMLKEDL